MPITTIEELLERAPKAALDYHPLPSFGCPETDGLDELVDAGLMGKTITTEVTRCGDETTVEYETCSYKISERGRDRALEIFAQGMDPLEQEVLGTMMLTPWPHRGQTAKAFAAGSVHSSARVHDAYRKLVQAGLIERNGGHYTVCRNGQDLYGSMTVAA